jgi:hypothetical protein
MALHRTSFHGLYPRWSDLDPHQRTLRVLLRKYPATTCCSRTATLSFSPFATSISRRNGSAPKTDGVNERNGDVTPAMRPKTYTIRRGTPSGRNNSLPSEPRISPHAKSSWCELHRSLSGSQRRCSCETASNSTREIRIRAAEFLRRRLLLTLVLIGESCVRGKWNGGLSACRCTFLKNRSARRY